MEKKSSINVFLLPCVLLAFAVVVAGRSYQAMTREVFSFSVNQKVVLIDAGHGGWERGGRS